MSVKRDFFQQKDFFVTNNKIDRIFSVKNLKFGGILMNLNKTYSNSDAIKSYVENIKDQFKSGTNLKNLNALEEVQDIQAMIDRLYSMNCDDKTIYKDLKKPLSDLAEWLIQHTNDDGTYKEETTNINKHFAIKTDKQFERDNHDGQKRRYKRTGTKDKIRASAIPFSDFLCSDSEGNQFYSFEQYDAMQHNDTYFNDNTELYLNIVKQLTAQEKSVFDYKIQGFTQENISKVTGLSIKQVRGRLNKIRAKTQDVIGDIA